MPTPLLQEVEMVLSRVLWKNTELKFWLVSFVFCKVSVMSVVAFTNTCMLLLTSLTYIHRKFMEKMYKSLQGSRY